MSDFNDFIHKTVLYDELLTALQIQPGSKVIDCTAGGGGHSQGMLQLVGAQGKVFALDRDTRAIQTLRQRFAAQLAHHSLELHHMPFSQIDSLAAQGPFAGIAADLGVSSPQIDEAERGFSFQHDGPLDMRMDRENTLQSAADVIATYSAKELEGIFRRLGEEPKARFVANAIVKQRELSPITTTKQLADLVSRAIIYSQKSKKHPATKVFQALRIHVNSELAEIQTLLEKAFHLLAPGGRLAIISFHSLEDRIVKHFFQEKAGKNQKSQIPRGLPLTATQLQALQGVEARIIKPFPLVPSEEETRTNPRARSAKLRVLEKLAPVIATP